MNKIELSEAERRELEGFIGRGKANARNIKRNREEAWIVVILITRYSVLPRTSIPLRRRLVLIAVDFAAGVV